jgi:hypothetical protein
VLRNVRSIVFVHHQVVKCIQESTPSKPQILSASNASPTAEDFTSPFSTSFHTSSLTQNTKSLAALNAVNLQAALGPFDTDVGSLPGVVPLNSSQVSLTLVAHVALSIVAVSPKLELMLTSSLPLDALTFLMTTLRLALCLQLPQERYSLLNVSTVKLLRSIIHP